MITIHLSNAANGPYLITIAAVLLFYVSIQKLYDTVS